jgi:hypothetical protein
MAVGPFETKAVAAPSATLVFGYLSGLLIEVVPWLKDNLTADQQQNLPIVLAFLASLLAAYLAPHTHRPDLMEPVTATPQEITDVPLPESEQPRPHV